MARVKCRGCRREVRASQLQLFRDKELCGTCRDQERERDRIKQGGETSDPYAPAALEKANRAWLKSHDRDAVAFRACLVEYQLSWEEYQDLRHQDVQHFRAFQRRWTDLMLLAISRSLEDEECLDRATLFSRLESIVISKGSSVVSVPTPPSRSVTNLEESIS